MRVSGLVITHQLSEKGGAWLAAVAQVVDELVAVVDEERAQPEVTARLEAIGARIFRPHWRDFYPSDAESREMIAACKGDWILKVDHDEELSPEWHDPAWREILRESEFTHFWLPRRWVVPGGEFLDSEPWWPDWQLRLFKNRPEEVTFARELHDFMAIAGPGGYLRSLSIHHHDLCLCSRSVREEKALTYETLRPGGGLGYFYLYEDWEIQKRPLPSTSHFQLATEVLRMDLLSPHAGRVISIEAEPPPRSLRRQALFWIKVAVTNASAETLRSGAPHPINLSYHWLRLPSREMVVFDGRRTALLPELPPGQTGSWRMFVIAPEIPGDYTLQVSLVQEGARWLEKDHTGLPLEFEITGLCATTPAGDPLPRRSHGY